MKTVFFEYRIVAVPFNGDEPTHETLESKVRKLMLEGFAPLGAPFFGVEMMYQAMTKSVEKEK